MKGAVAVGKGLSGNTTLEELYLSWNAFGDKAPASAISAGMLNSSVKVIDLSNNRVADLGATMIAAAIPVKKNLDLLKVREKNCIVVVPYVVSIVGQQSSWADWWSGDHQGCCKHS